MAVNDRRRQKKLEKQRARKKEERRALARRSSQSVSAKLRLAGEGAVIDCWMGESYKTDGIAQVAIARSAPGGMVGMVIFLVDGYCLGIKDAICKFISRPEYHERYRESLHERPEMKPTSPARARKYVEGAARYAESIGLSNHPDYAAAKLIFGDADPQACTEEFVYGKDGKPLYINGPNDSPARSQQIVKTLEARLGTSGFHFLVATSPYEMDIEGDWNSVEDWEDDGGEEGDGNEDVLEGQFRYARDPEHKP